MLCALVSDSRIGVLMIDCLQFSSCHHAAGVATHKTPV